MPTQTFEGYFENGVFYFNGRVVILPERRKVSVTVFNEPTANTTEISDTAQAWRDFFGVINADGEGVPEFERVRFTREVEL